MKEAVSEICPNSFWVQGKEGFELFIISEKFSN
jgi:hypothetical protein